MNNLTFHGLGISRASVPPRLMRVALLSERALTFALGGRYDGYVAQQLGIRLSARLSFFVHIALLEIKKGRRFHQSLTVW